VILTTESLMLFGIAVVCTQYFLRAIVGLPRLVKDPNKYPLKMVHL